MAKDRISHTFREMKPYIVRTNDDAITRRGAPASPVADGVVDTGGSAWLLNDGNLLNDGLFLNES